MRDQADRIATLPKRFKYISERRIKKLPKNAIPISMAYWMRVYTDTPQNELCSYLIEEPNPPFETTANPYKFNLLDYTRLIEKAFDVGVDPSTKDSDNSLQSERNTQKRSTTFYKPSPTKGITKTAEIVRNKQNPRGPLTVCYHIFRS
jgi:hypothetical protein